MTIPPDMTITEAVKIMNDYGFDQLPVVDAHEGVLGVVTLGNLTSKILAGRARSEDTVKNLMFKQFTQARLFSYECHIHPIPSWLPHPITSTPSHSVCPIPSPHLISRHPPTPAGAAQRAALVPQRTLQERRILPRDCDPALVRRDYAEITPRLRRDYAEIVDYFKTVACPRRVPIGCIFVR